MTTWINRYIESDRQNKQYNQKKKDGNICNVKKQIENWIISNSYTDYLSDPLGINLTELNKLVVDRDINNPNTTQLQKDTQDKVWEFEQEIWGKAFKEPASSMKTVVHDKSKKYLWVTFREDGMVIAVGETSMKSGDLLKYSGLHHSSIGDIRIILHQLMENEEKKLLDKLLKNLYSYAAYALVIAIKSIPPSNTTVKKLETELGEYLINNGINILNRYSHLN
ncbi:hypothetical protein [Brochothrix campestris]|uniref:Uncharacterized protein n=1 Tax=Brochothrix campestris FSL F6-1037 TaxID=1265861 RepID=W7CE69_9LIST|nr:hypothetical protein [Brochothrix campestris]EUJ34101.1 hypothetical protein BCAMP_12758 [Brochothrix campestris FSL F6-1037]